MDFHFSLYLSTMPFHTRLILFENILFSSISSIEGYIESIIHDLFVLAERRNQWKKSINRIEDHLCGKIGKKFWKMKGTMNQWLYKKKRKRKRRGKNRGFLGGKTADTNRVNKRGSYTYGGKFSASNIVTLFESDHPRCRTFRRRKETFSRTMGTMRNNFAAVFVLHILMHLTSQSLPPPRGTNENSSKRNSLSELRSTSSPIYECLFLDPDLPICDEELWVLLRYQNSSLIFFFLSFLSCKYSPSCNGMIN